MSSRPRDGAARSLQQSAPVFAALGDATRLLLVSRLSSGTPLSIRRLTEGSRLTRQAITKHLRVLASSGLVRGVRRGRESLYELRPKPLDEARSALESISRQWDDALARLRSFVEE
jgi:DNA-binding transcriptional ArsR family regulator